MNDIKNMIWNLFLTTWVSLLIYKMILMVAWPILKKLTLSSSGNTELNEDHDGMTKMMMMTFQW